MWIDSTIEQWMELWSTQSRVQIQKGSIHSATKPDWMENWTKKLFFVRWESCQMANSSRITAWMSFTTDEMSNVTHWRIYTSVRMRQIHVCFWTNSICFFVCVLVVAVNPIYWKWDGKFRQENIWAFETRSNKAKKDLHCECELKSLTKFPIGILIFFCSVESKTK